MDADIPLAPSRRLFGVNAIEASSALERYSRRGTLVLLCAMLIWAPLPLGSNRAVFWVVNGFFTSLIVCVFLLGAWRRLLHVSNLRLTACLVAGFTVVIGWMVLQAVPIESSFFSHPLRKRLAEGLANAYGAISANPSASLATVAEFTPPILLGVVAAFVGANRRHAAFLLKVVVVWTTLLAVYGLSALYFGFDQILLIKSDAYPGSLVATFVGRGAAATYFAIGLVCAGALLGERMADTVRVGGLRQTPLDFAFSLLSRDGAYLVFVAILLCALLNTGSRSGTVSGLIGLFVVGIASWRPLAAGGRGRVGALVVVALVVGIAAVSSTHLAHRLETVDPASDVRFLLYGDTVRMIRDRPLLGHGAGVFADLYPMFQSPEVPVTRIWNKAHDSYLQAASELGLPVVFLLLASATISLIRIVRGAAVKPNSGSTPIAAFGAFVVVGLHSTFDFSLQVQAVAITFAIVAGAGYGQSNSQLINPGVARQPMLTKKIARLGVVVLLFAGVGITFFASARLRLVVSSIPQQLRLLEVFPLVITSHESIEPNAIATANAAARWINDPSLATARLLPCGESRREFRSQGNVQGFRQASQDCLDIIDQALAENPASGELWLERSKLVFGLPFAKLGLLESLRRSYETTPRVGWLAARRSVVALRVYSSLPEDLKKRAREELALLVKNPDLVRQVVSVFIADKSFRQAVIPVLETLDAQDQETFVALVKHKIDSSGADQ